MKEYLSYLLNAVGYNLLSFSGNQMCINSDDSSFIDIVDLPCNYSSDDLSRSIICESSDDSFSIKVSSRKKAADVSEFDIMASGKNDNYQTSLDFIGDVFRQSISIGRDTCYFHRELFQSDKLVTTGIKCSLGENEEEWTVSRNSEKIVIRKRHDKCFLFVYVNGRLIEEKEVFYSDLLLSSLFSVIDDIVTGCDESIKTVSSDYFDFICQRFPLFQRMHTLYEDSFDADLLDELLIKHHIFVYDEQDSIGSVRQL